MLDVSVIIVSYNCCDLLSQCLKSIYEHTTGLNYEIIVVDNNSKDDTRAILEEQFPKVIGVYNDQNCGFAAANNQGLKIASGQYYLLLNPDTVFHENSVFKTLEFAKRQPMVGIVGCRLVNFDGSHQSSAYGFPSWLSSSLESLFIYKLIPRPYAILNYRIQRLSLERPTQVDWVMGAFFLMEGRVVETVGILDERFFMYGEELDLCLRAKKAGFEVWYFPMTTVYHLWGGKNSLSRRSVAWVTISHNLFLLKHYGTLHRLIIQSITDIGLSARIVLYALLGIILFSKTYFMKALNVTFALRYGGNGNTDYFRVPR